MFLGALFYINSWVIFITTADNATLRINGIFGAQKFCKKQFQTTAGAVQTMPLYSLAEALQKALSSHGTSDQSTFLYALYRYIHES